MDKLSTEILLSIFFYLHYEQKKQCKLVCRSWMQTLQSSGLELETVKVPLYSKSSPSQLVYRFVKNLPNQSGCRRLSLLQFHNKAKLAARLPKLKFLAFCSRGKLEQSFCVNTPQLRINNTGGLEYPNDPATEEPQQYTNQEIQQLANWHEGLETLVDISFTAAFFVFLNTGIFRRLTTLVLSPSIYNSSPDLEEIFDGLKNTPHLKSLHLSQIPVNFSRLETLHNNVPFLETLRLSNFRSEDYFGPKPLQIKSKATLMKKLDIDWIAINFERSIDILQYILLKYTDLEEFRITTQYFEQIDEWIPFFTQFLRITKSTLTSLKVNVPIELSNFITLLQENDVLSLRTLELNLLLDDDYEIQKELEIVRKKQLAREQHYQQNGQSHNAQGLPDQRPINLQAVCQQIVQSPLPQIQLSEEEFVRSQISQQRQYQQNHFRRHPNSQSQILYPPYFGEPQIFGQQHPIPQYLRELFLRQQFLRQHLLQYQPLLNIVLRFFYFQWQPQNPSKEERQRLLQEEKQQRLQEQKQVQSKQPETLDTKMHRMIGWIDISSITSLSLKGAPAIKFGIFKELYKLKELKLSFDPSTIYIAELNAIIKQVPDSLEALSLSKMHACVEEEEEEEKGNLFISGIKRLELLECEIGSDLSDFLSNQLPKLNGFILECKSMIFDIRLPHHYLSLVDIHITHGTREFPSRDISTQGLLALSQYAYDPFKVTVGNTTHIYDLLVKDQNLETSFKDIFDVHDRSMHYVHKPSNRSLKQDELHFHFQCKSVQTFFYNGYLLLV